MPDGRAFQDPTTFKQLLIADRDIIARAFVEHLSTYALRRVLTFDDKADIDAIVAEAKKHDYRLQDIVKAVATSELLQKR
jgi:hypothetical protein